MFRIARLCSLGSILHRSLHNFDQLLSFPCSEDVCFWQMSLRWSWSTCSSGNPRKERGLPKTLKYFGVHGGSLHPMGYSREDIFITIIIIIIEPNGHIREDLQVPREAVGRAQEPRRKQPIPWSSKKPGLVYAWNTGWFLVGIHIALVDAWKQGSSQGWVDASGQSLTFTNWAENFPTDQSPTREKSVVVVNADGKWENGWRATEINALCV